MVKEINNPLHLLRLVQAKRITLENYQLRMAADRLNISTYKETT
tara:strand:+ start:7887 stop:8018 length:132 start_codon:yes stop_codon:yes gene_type:complete